MMLIRRVSVFSKDDKGGNRAAVVIETTKMTDEIRQHMATQIGYSETVFLKSQKTGIFLRVSLRQRRKWTCVAMLP